MIIIINENNTIIELCDYVMNEDDNAFDAIRDGQICRYTKFMFSYKSNIIVPENIIPGKYKYEDNKFVLNPDYVDNGSKYYPTKKQKEELSNKNICDIMKALINIR